MKLQHTDIDGVEIHKPVVHGDNRGEFQELFNLELASNYFPDGIAQVSRSVSAKNVFRGLHFQIGMSKYIRVTRGAALIYNVDLRVNSPTFLQCVEVVLTEKTPALVFAPDWCARGLFALENNTEVEYFHDTLYHPPSSYAIKWNDPQLNIVIPYHAPILSDRDKTAMSVSEWLGTAESKSFLW